MKIILLRVLNCLREDKMYDKYISLSDRNYEVIIALLSSQ